MVLSTTATTMVLSTTTTTTGDLIYGLEFSNRTHTYRSYSIYERQPSFFFLLLSDKITYILIYHMQGKYVWLMNYDKNNTYVFNVFG
jgi:hypothetical protein